MTVGGISYGQNPTKNSFKTLSKRARLLLNREGYDVEFKQSLGGLANSDLVAFANSQAGGSILTGVRKTKTGEAHQKGEIVGCPNDKCGINPSIHF